MNSLFLALHLSAATLAGAADTQQPNSWSAWYGCWQAEGAPANEIICIAPTKTGVRISTVVDGAVQDESSINTDGLARRIQQDGCTGTERARWSRDRQRVFLDSDVACNGSARRSVRGLFAFVAPDEWVSVQSASEGDSVATRVVRFLAVNSDRVPTNAASFAAARMVSDGMYAVEESDVAEAVEHMGALAADEWMREAGEPFQLGYKSQDRGSGSALDQVDRFSNPAPVREVVRVVERPVYVHNTYYDSGYGWYYSPWGHHHHHYGWYWYPRPIVVVRLPIVIYRNSHYRHDYYRYRNRYYSDGRYDRYDRYDRNDNRRRDWDNDRDNDRDRGRVTRDGYSSGRARARTETTSATTQVERTTRAPDTRDRSSVTRERSSDTRDRSTETRERTSQPRERASDSRDRSSGSSRESARASSAPRSSSGGGSGTRTARPRASSGRD
jgi:hypothetical protein